MSGKALVLALLYWSVLGTPGRVLDADTFEARLRIWLGLEVYEMIRVLGVDAPEMRGPTAAAGLEAKRFAQAWLAKGDVLIAVCKRDSFGRLLGAVTREGENLADVLIHAGHGVAR